MTDKTAIIQFHRATAECWRAKDRPLFAEAHKARAESLRAGAKLADLEKHGSAWEIWGEIAQTVRL